METDSRIGLLKAAVRRRDDAYALLEKERWRGAMYLGGYAIECKLKAQLLDYTQSVRREWWTQPTEAR